MLGMLGVITVLTGAAQLVVAQAVASHEGADSNHFRPRHAIAVSTAAGAGLMVLVAGISPILDSLLRLSSPVPVIVLSVVMVPSLIAIVPVGILLGRRQYSYVGAFLVAVTFGRLVVSTLLVLAGLGLDGALSGVVVGQTLALLVIAFPVWREVRCSSGSFSVRLRWRSAFLAALAQTGLAALAATDSVVARHFLPPLAAGHYVAAATASRIALFAPNAVSLLAFPRFAALRSESAARRRVLLDALAATAALSGGAALFMVAMPTAVIGILFGPAYQAATPILQILAPAGAALGVTTLLVYYHQALMSRRAAWPWFGVVVIALVVLLWFHGSPNHIAWTMLTGTTVVLALCTPIPFLLTGRPRRARRS